MNRYNPVHDDAMVADENGTHVRYADHVRALSGFVAGTPKGAAMESVDAIAQKLIPCTCGGYGENNRRHMSDCPRFRVAWEDIAAALRAERENTDAANAAAVNAYAKVRELEALLDGAKSALAAERAKFAAFAGPDGEPMPVLGTLPVTEDGAIAGMGGELYYHNRAGEVVSLPLGWRLEISQEPSWEGGEGFYSTKQAAEAAAGGKK